jgi:pyruvate dehydrogenase E1 component alpha subunit
VDDIRANKDCIKKFSGAVIGAGVVGPAELEAIDAQTRELIERAVKEAKAAAPPTGSDLLTDVYVRY